ncbi:HIT family protein [Streptococcus massiliensis]|uniref:HIT family protein n=1 Tax=Streptococcus massiliensis TaxID=313439 RepID=A0A380L031_9STRE|nr:HIT family protein [Streptococcus massiliensis]SUN76909.1 HIT family protein [Streptococcus massiliensis]
MCLICERIEWIKENRNPYFVAELETGYVVLGDHQYFRGYTLFLAKEHVRDLHKLEPEFKLQFLAEMSLVEEAVAECFAAEKMNVDLLGNGDAHLHWHLFPRREGDMKGYGIKGRGPVWWVPFEEMTSEDSKLAPEEMQMLKEQLKQTLINKIKI